MTLNKICIRCCDFLMKLEFVFAMFWQNCILFVFLSIFIFLLIFCDILIIFTTFSMKFMFFLWFWLFFSPQDLLTIFAIFVFLGEGDPYTKFMLFLWFIDVIHSCFCDLVFLWIFDKTCSLFMIFWQNSYWKILHGASTFHSFNCQFFTFSCQVATGWCLFSS